MAIIAAPTAINLRTREVLWPDGTVTFMATLLDIEGDHTDSIEDARTAVCPTPFGTWATLILAEYGFPTLH